MAVLKGVNKALLVSAAILAILILIVILATMITTGPSVEPIILNTISLRNVEDPVTKAQLISVLDELVADTQNAPINEQWGRVTSCLGQKCPDDAFFDTIFVVASEYSPTLPNSELVMNILFVNRYWNDDEKVVEFSKSLSAIDAAVPLLNDREVERDWNKVVECNNACSEKNDLYFEMLRDTVQ